MSSRARCAMTTNYQLSLSRPPQLRNAAHGYMIFEAHEKRSPSIDLVVELSNYASKIKEISAAIISMLIFDSIKDAKKLFFYRERGGAGWLLPLFNPFLSVQFYHSE